MSSVELRDRHLRLVDGDRRLDFHLRWLRHNCDLDRHPATGERLIDSADLPDQLAATAARVDGDVLAVTWAGDGRTSRYPLAWLRAHAYAIDRDDVAPPPSNVALIELDPRGVAPDALAAAALDRVRSHGAAIVRAAAVTPDPAAATEPLIAAFEARRLRVVPTHFGRIEDLRTDNTTNANTDQLGYTDAGIELHTDQPFLDEPPRYQLLQSIRVADRGGDSTVADALAGYRYLQATDAAAAALLRATPVRFHRKQRAFERVVIAPIIDEPGGTFRVRSSYFTIAPFHLPFAQMEAWYAAYDTFVRLLRTHAYRFRLEPGDYLLYDNHRVLHGRTAFAGPRWVRGIYFDPADAVTPPAA